MAADVRFAAVVEKPQLSADIGAGASAAGGTRYEIVKA